MATTRSLTILSNWAVTLVRALDAAGVNGRGLAAQAGIAPQVLDDPSGRVSRTALTELWRLAVAATGDDAFALTVARYATPTTFHALGYAILASATAREALERTIRFRRVIGDVNRPRLEEVGARLHFVIDVSAPPGVPFESVDAFAAVLVRQLRFLVGDQRFAPVAVALRRPCPRQPERFEQAFHAPVRFAAIENVLEFEREDLERPLPTGNADLAQQSDRVVIEYLARMESSQWSSRVSRSLIEALPNGLPAQAEIARRLGASTRGLQRELAREGTSYREILDDARAVLARDYVRAKQLSVTEIAFLLGFADTSAFSRAFKRWTGASPRHFASAQRAKPAAPAGPVD